MLTACPDCGGSLGKSASKCRCGWTAPWAKVEGAPAYTPCASSGCRYPGRLWLRTLAPNERVCVNHYYSALDRNPDLCRDDVVPPKPMMTAAAKNVAGDR